MSCILHARGERFAVDDFLEGVTFQAYRVYHQGDPVRKTGRTHEDSGFILIISDADAQYLSQQIADAFEYLHSHEQSFRKLAKRTDVEDKRFDFLCEVGRNCLQSEYFPSDFLALAGKLGISVELSLYVGEKRLARGRGSMRSMVVRRNS